MIHCACLNPSIPVPEIKAHEATCLAVPDTIQRKHDQAVPRNVRHIAYHKSTGCDVLR